MAGRSEAQGRPVRRRKAKRTWKGKLKLFLGGGLLVLFCVGLVAGGFWFWALGQAEGLMPSIESKLDAMRTPPSEIISADGHVLYQVSAEFREPVALGDIPALVKKAMLDAEDKRFYEHSGVDLFALARVAFLGAREGRFSQGGSTLTMQLAKRLHSNGERTLQRKLLDMAIATKMEEEWNKDRILQLYLNEVYFGSGAYGIRAAADVYFGKPLDKLTVAEAAMLARCVRRPSDENPFRNLDRAIANRNVVLQTMLDNGDVTQAQYDKAIKEKVRLNPHRRDANGRPELAPYVVSAVEAELRKNYPDVRLSDGGCKVYTTVDWDMQRATEQAVHEVVAKHAAQKVNTAAFVLMDGEGRILAEVGGADFGKDQFNVVTQGHRQPGSSFKPFVYAAAFALGKLTPDGLVSDDRLVYRDPSTGSVWSPENDNKRYGGMISVRSAVANSINVAAARTILDVGVDNVVSLAHNVFGFTSELPEYPSLALGACSVSPLEMAQAYAVFMLRGSRPSPFIVARVETPDGIKTTTPHVMRNLISSGVCDGVDSLLRAVVTSGTGTRALSVPDARGKTGTTSDNRDAWFCGYANGLVGIGWAGNERYDKRLKANVPLPMRSSVFGGTVTIEMWSAVEKAAYAKFGDRYSRMVNDQPPPDDVQVHELSASADPSADQAPPAVVDPAKAPPADPAAGSTAGATDGQTGLGAAPDGGRAQAPPSGPVDPRFGQPPSGTAPPRAVKAKPRARPTEYVEVQICADSGELATEYCPETVTRRFVKGHEPKKYCHLHHE